MNIEEVLKPYITNVIYSGPHPFFTGVLHELCLHNGWKISITGLNFTKPKYWDIELKRYISDYNNTYILKQHLTIGKVEKLLKIVYSLDVESELDLSKLKL